MSDPESDLDKSALNWDFKLLFDEPVAPKAETRAPEIPPRVIIKDRYPRIFTQIDLTWGTPELQQYLERTLFTDRNGRQGFPPDVMSALMKIYTEHTKVLKAKGYNRDDVWDL